MSSSMKMAGIAPPKEAGRKRNQHTDADRSEQIPIGKHFTKSTNSTRPQFLQCLDLVYFANSVKLLPKKLSEVVEKSRIDSPLRRWFFLRGRIAGSSCRRADPAQRSVRPSLGGVGRRGNLLSANSRILRLNFCAKSGNMLTEVYFL